MDGSVPIRPVLKTVQSYAQTFGFFHADGYTLLFGYLPSENIKEVICKMEGGGNGSSLEIG